MSPESESSFDPNALPPTLPECCLKVLARPGWYDAALLRAVRIQPANLFVRAISSPRVAGMEIAATTIGHTIYFRDPAYFDPHSPDGLALLAHEIRHIEQYREQGGVVRFSINYLLEYLRGGYGTDISAEAEAYELGSTVQAHLEAEFAYNAGQVLCEITPAGHTPNLLYSFLTPYPALPRRV
ncbi:MAG: DUF4157 domain-containing protein [Anaerolineae bacterium]